MKEQKSADCISPAFSSALWNKTPPAQHCLYCFWGVNRQAGSMSWQPGCVSTSDGEQNSVHGLGPWEGNNGIQAFHSPSFIYLVFHPALMRHAPGWPLRYESWHLLKACRRTEPGLSEVFYKLRDSTVVFSALRRGNWHTEVLSNIAQSISDGTRIWMQTVSLEVLYS